MAARVLRARNKRSTISGSRVAFGGTRGIVVAVSHEVIAIPYEGLLNGKITKPHPALKKCRNAGINHWFELQHEEIWQIHYFI